MGSHMRRRLNAAGILTIAAAISACSSGDQTYFETEGLRAPVAMCNVKPDDVGIAEQMRDIDENNGCHVDNAWRVMTVADVTFSQPATVNCGVVGPLNDWLAKTVQPAARDQFSEAVTGIDIAASYSCRPRNNTRGAKMSEHGYGNAIDISAFTLASGRKVTVRDGWRGSSGERAFLRHVRSDACGRFATVLGPGSDRHHGDHFHLDMQNRRSGQAYCR